jgi:hypothetical protein
MVVRYKTVKERKRIKRSFDMKASYSSQHSAQRAVLHFIHKNNDFLVIEYGCPYCEKWHVGHLFGKTTKAEKVA